MVFFAPGHATDSSRANARDGSDCTDLRRNDAAGRARVAERARCRHFSK